MRRVGPGERGAVSCPAQDAAAQTRETATPEPALAGGEDHLSARGNKWVAALLHERIAQLASVRRRLE